MNASPTRRTFLAGSAAAGLLGLLPSGLLAGPQRPKHRTVIFLHLRGGNDGLNTVVPLRSRAYARLRPTLAIRKPLPLDDDVGLHPSLAPLHALHERGRVAIVQGVGWPHASLSHFAMTDTWHAGRADARDGWVGRALEREGGHGLATLAVDREPPLLFHASVARTLTFRDPRSLKLPAGLDATLGLLYRAESVRAGIPGEVARRGAAALETAARLASIEKIDLGREDALASSLGLALALVEQVPHLRAIHIAHDGYDTHANQAKTHSDRLKELGAGLAAAVRHLDDRDPEGRGLARRVLFVVWSEFGRRVAENASAGTDHGTAGPVFFVGDGLRGGLHGDAPSLDNLRDGNLVPTTDLRRIAAEILARAWGLDPKPVIGAHAPLEIIS